MLGRVVRRGAALRPTLLRAAATAVETKLSFTLNGKSVSCAAGATILEAARDNGAYVPTVCYHPRLAVAGKCGVCVVEVEGTDFPFQLSCTVPVEEGMKINTETPAVIQKRAKAMRKIARTTDPKAYVDGKEFLTTIDKTYSADADRQTASIQFAPLCVGCTRCVRACSDLQGMNILEMDPDTQFPGVMAVGGADISDTECISCGQCTTLCPTGAITERDDVHVVDEALNSGKICVMQTAPAPRVAVSECFDLPPGSVHTSKMVGAAKKAGFMHVFDTNFTADLTIMEEGSELLQRIDEGGPFPMFTSCCPGWINMVEKVYPEFIPNLSTCRSPHMMMAPLIKEYWADKMGIDHKDIFTVSLMPCSAKKDDVGRKEMWYKGRPSCDAVLTTREFGRLLKKRGVTDWDTIPEVPYDDPLGQSTGAAVLFGVTGGVMEAALRTAYELKTGTPLPTLNFEPCRGLEGVKKFEVPLPGEGAPLLKFAVVNGGKNVHGLLKAIKSGAEDFHFIEVMACPSGCIGGGGQPRSVDPEIMNKRMNAIYDTDEKMTLRKSHENKAIQFLYEDFLEKPLGHKSHELLHTHYFDRRVKAEDDSSTVKSGAAGGSLILYGSQGGNAAKVARTLEELLDAQTKAGADCLPMDQFDVTDLPKWDNVLLVTSTFGVGEFPANALKFWEALNDETLPADLLSNTKYSVFGIGSDSYKYYCKAAFLLHDRMAALGADLLVDSENGNTSGPGQHWGAFDPWAMNVASALGGGGFSTLEPPAPKYRISTGLSAPSAARARLPPPDHHFAPLTESVLVTGEGYPVKRNVIRIDLDNTGLEYVTGDHVAIRPRNDPARVKAFLDFAGFPGSQVINIAPVESTQSTHMDFPATLTIQELFEQYIDMNAAPTAKFLREIALFAEPAEKEALLHLSDPDNKEEYLNFCQEYTVGETLMHYSTAIPPLDQLIGMAPVIDSRLYSIASAPELVGNKVEVLIALLDWKTPSGKARTGLTTDYIFNYIGDAADKPMMSVDIRKGILIPPEDPKTPVVMFGLGTGLGPFRAFCQQREALMAEGVEVGPATLFYSCRNRVGDYACGDELEEWDKSGVITNLHVAFSRDVAEGEPRMRIDRYMNEHAKEAWEAVNAEGAKMYYCGPSAVADQIINCCKDAAMSEGGLSETEAQAWVDMMDTGDAATSRWHVESF
jgi:NADH-quinone oxidoreductase subunit G